MHALWETALKEVLEGKADFATVAETPVMFAIMNGEKISIIATIQTSTKITPLLQERTRAFSPSKT